MHNPPFFTDDTIVFGLLMLLIGFVFYTSSKEEGFWKKFYGIVPALLMCYLLPSIFSSLHIIAPDWTELNDKGEEITKNIMIEWEKKLPDFDAKKWGLKKYLKGLEEVNEGAVGYWIDTVEGDEWLAGNLSYHLGEYQGIKNYGDDAVRARWIYGENLTLCGRYISVKNVLKNKCIKLK